MNNEQLSSPNELKYSNCHKRDCTIPSFPITLKIKFVLCNIGTTYLFWVAVCYFVFIYQKALVISRSQDSCCGIVLYTHLWLPPQNIICINLERLCSPYSNWFAQGSYPGFPSPYIHITFFHFWFTFLPWSWGQHVPPKCQYELTRLLSVATQATTGTITTLNASKCT